MAVRISGVNVTDADWSLAPHGMHSVVSALDMDVGSHKPHNHNQTKYRMLCHARIWMVLNEVFDLHMYCRMAAFSLLSGLRK